MYCKSSYVEKKKVTWDGMNVNQILKMHFTTSSIQQNMLIVKNGHCQVCEMVCNKVT